MVAAVVTLYFYVFLFVQGILLFLQSWSIIPALKYFRSALSLDSLPTFVSLSCGNGCKKYILSIVIISSYCISTIGTLSFLISSG